VGHLIYLAVIQGVEELRNPACIDLPTHVRDRDVFHDVEGRVFVVLGFIQPTNRILSFLKYVPDPYGEWQSGDVKYKRIFWGSVSSTVDGMNILPSDYIVQDSHFGTDLLEPPRESVAKYFSPEKRLEEIIDGGPKDSLEDLAKSGAETLHDALSIRFDNIGVAGSILWKGHSLGKSDINMNIYGFDTCWKLHDNYESLIEGREGARLRELPDWKHAISRVHARVPTMNSEDLQILFSRRKALCLGDVCIGITPILLPEEGPIQHGSETYTAVSTDPHTVPMEIENADFGIFHPAIYEGQSPPLDAIDGDSVSRIMIYDGAFGGLLRAGDQVEITGTLQRVVPSDGTPAFYQIMIGTKSGAGKEYIRLLT
jgi:predicted nucleotidyltransferase